MSIRIYENRTYRVVQRCFTWSSIFSFNANVFPNDDIFIMIKIIGFFYNRTYMRKRPFCIIVLTAWFNKSALFSISTLVTFGSSFGTISLDFDIFPLFFDITVWIHMVHQLWSVNFIAEVKNGSDRWISTMKFQEANHDGLPQCSPLIAVGKSYAFRS